MTTRINKKQRLMDSSTTSTIQLTEQQQVSDDSPRRIRKRRQIKKIIICYEPDGDQVEANDLVDFEYSKRDIHEILDYTNNTIEHEPDGSVIITPHPRHLPTEIISSIAHHLTNQRHLYHCTLVNQQFYVTVNPILWRAPNLRNKRSIERLLGWLAGAQQPWMMRQRIQKLTLIGDHWTDIHFAMLMPYLRDLKDLIINQPYNDNDNDNDHYHDIYNENDNSRRNTTKITNASIDMLPRHCPNLRSFHVHGFHCLDTSTLEALGQHAHQLRAFTLYGTRRTFPVLLHLLLLAKCPLLEDLTIYANDWSSFPITELKLMHRLTHLTIHNNDNLNETARGLALSNFNNDPMTTGGPPPWPHLTHFAYHNGDSTTLNNAQLIPFLQSHPQLLCLKLNGGDYTDCALEAIPPLVSSLHLQLNFKITSGAARRLIQTRPRLTSATFLACFHIPIADFPEISSKVEYTVVLDQKAIDKVRQAAQG